MSLRNIEEQLKVNSAILRGLQCGNTSETIQGPPDFLNLPIASLRALDEAEKGLADNLH